jgi:hypothetical protein
MFNRIDFSGAERFSIVFEQISIEIIIFVIDFDGVRNSKKRFFFEFENIIVAFVVQQNKIVIFIEFDCV